MRTEAQRSKRVASYLTATLTVLMLIRCVIAWPDLPDPMASHFDGNGVPNGFQSRATFMSILFGTQAMLAFSFVVGPRLMRFIPPALISLPYASYWRRPQHIGEALDRYAAWSMWFLFGNFTMMFGIFELVLQSNLNLQPMNATLMWIVVGGYMVGALIGIVRLFAAFKPPA